MILVDLVATEVTRVVVEVAAMDLSKEIVDKHYKNRV